MADGCPKLGNALTMAHCNQNALLVSFDLPMNYSTIMKMADNFEIGKSWEMLWESM